MSISKVRKSGFSLVELMIVVAVISILATIGFSNYQDYLVKATRASAQSYLMAIASKQEEYAIRNGGYATGGSFQTDLKLTEPAEVTQFYVVRVDPLANGFQAVAAVRAGTRQFGDGDLTVDHRGAKTGRW